MSPNETINLRACPIRESEGVGIQQSRCLDMVRFRQSKEFNNVQLQKGDTQKMVHYVDRLLTIPVVQTIAEQSAMQITIDLG